MKQRKSRVVKKNGIRPAAQGTSAGGAIKKVLRQELRSSSLSLEECVRDLLDMLQVGRHEKKANSKVPLKVKEQTETPERNGFNDYVHWREVRKLREELRQLLRGDRPMTRRRRTKKLKLALNMPRLPSQLVLPSTSTMYLVFVRRCATSKDGLLLDYGPSRVYFPTWKEIPKKFTAEMAHRYAQRYCNDQQSWNDIPEMAMVYNIFHKFWFRNALFSVEVQDEEDLVENYEEYLMDSALGILYHLCDWGPDPRSLYMYGGWMYHTKDLLNWPAVELKLEPFASEEEEEAFQNARILELARLHKREDIYQNQAVKLPGGIRNRAVIDQPKSPVDRFVSIME